MDLGCVRNETLMTSYWAIGRQSPVQRLVLSSSYDGFKMAIFKTSPVNWKSNRFMYNDCEIKRVLFKTR